MRASIARRGSAPPDRAVAGAARRRRCRHGLRRPRTSWRRRASSQGLVDEALAGVRDPDRRRGRGARLDEPAGPDGSTVRHLLAHASGLAWDSPIPLGRPGERRIYSNTGYLALAEHVAGRTEMAFADYLRAGVLEPLGLDATLEGDAAAGSWARSGTCSRSAARRLRRRCWRLRRRGGGHGPVLRSRRRAARLLRRRNDWGLGFELRNGKSPHWTGSRNSARTYGHFGSKPGTATFSLDRSRAAARRRCGRADVSFGDWADRVACARGCATGGSRAVAG